jgi:hypothetical protein
MKILIATILCLVLVTGCYMSKFSDDGYPNFHADPYIVGGGQQIDFKIPCNGTAMLVDAHSRKVLITKTFKSGDTFSIHPSAHPFDKEFDWEHSQLVLYFFPGSPELNNIQKCEK